LPKGKLRVYEMTPTGRFPVTTVDLNHSIEGDTEVALGAERDIIFQRQLNATTRTDLEFDRFGRVSGYDVRDEFSDALRNRLSTPATLKLTEIIPGKWGLVTDLPTTTKEDNKITWEFTLAPGELKQITFTIVRRTGTRAD